MMRKWNIQRQRPGRDDATHRLTTEDAPGFVVLIYANPEIEWSDDVLSGIADEELEFNLSEP